MMKREYGEMALSIQGRTMVTLELPHCFQNMDVVFILCGSS